MIFVITSDNICIGAEKNNMFFLIRYGNAIVAVRHEGVMEDDPPKSPLGLLLERIEGNPPPVPVSRYHGLIIDDLDSGLISCRCGWIGFVDTRRSSYSEIYRKIEKEFRWHRSHIAKLEGSDPCENCKLNIDCKFCMS